MLALFRTNGGCDLPCLFTLCPGVADRASLLAFTQEVTAMANANDMSVHLFDPSGTGTPLIQTSTIRGSTRLIVDIDLDPFLSRSVDSLDYLEVHIAASFEEQVGGEIVSAHTSYGNPLLGEVFRAFLLPQVLSKYGRPSEVLLLPILYDPPSLLDSVFSLVIVYQDEHFFLEYIFPNASSGSDFRACPGDTGEIHLVTWAPHQDPSLAELARLTPGPGLNELSVDYYKPVEEATSLTLNDFSLMFANDKGSSCLRTPKAMWPY